MSIFGNRHYIEANYRSEQNVDLVVLKQVNSGHQEISFAFLAPTKDSISKIQATMETVNCYG
mgnify:CR=1 FL=1